MYYLGIDVGGTTTETGVVDESGAASHRRDTPTEIHSFERLIDALSAVIESYRKQFDIRAVGMGVPGLRSHRTAVIETSPNIPCLRGANLERALAARAGIPVVTDNDANAAAHGEWACGAGRGLQHMVYVSLGTGLGSGLMLSGRLFRGSDGYAGELGHTVVEPGGRLCSCGWAGCLETRVSATGMVLTAEEYLKKHPDSALRAAPSLTAKAIYDAAAAGDAAALAVFEETGRYLGMACANLINLLNPEAIVLGGGVLASSDLLLPHVRAEIERRAFPHAARRCALLKSALWPNAGWIGAALLARDQR